MADRLIVDLFGDGRVGVSRQLHGEVAPTPGPDPVELVVPLSEKDLGELAWYLERYLVAPFGVYEDRGPEIADRLVGWGEALFGSVFGGGGARDAYRSVRDRDRGVGLEIDIRSDDPGLLGLPWELMVDPERSRRLVTTAESFNRMLLTANLEPMAQVAGEGLRVLMVIARPAGLADVDYGMIARPLLERLEAVRGRVTLEVLRPPTLEQLEQRLGEAADAGVPFHVVHFDGHGALGEAPGGGSPSMYDGAEGQLLFEDSGGAGSLVSATQFAQVVRAGGVPVVVLNACQSGALGEVIESAVATRVLKEGAMSSVVAMSYSVYAVAAAEFMAAFYDGLFAGDPVGVAVTKGRRRLERRPGRPSPKGDMALADWVVPVHYVRGDVSFPHLKAAPAAAGRHDFELDAILDKIDNGPEGADVLAARDGVFVGRDDSFFELEAVCAHERVGIIVGPAGTGKTEVAKAFGRWRRDTGALDHPDGVFFMSFEPGVASFGLDGVINTIGTRLFPTEFHQLDREHREEVVVSVLRDHRFLVVWDNFESVHSMPDPHQATATLNDNERTRLKKFVDQIGAPDGKTTLLITSRSPEPWLETTPRRLGLGGLGERAADAYTDHLLNRLPNAQARRKQRAFGELKQWLHGHPLSMRLILPQLEVTDPANLLDALKGNSELPAGFEADQGRTESLGASIHYSLVQLDDTTRQLLPAVALFESVVDAEVLRVFSASEQVPERFAGIDTGQWIQALDAAAATGLLTPLGANTYSIHPALPAYLHAQWKLDATDQFETEHNTATNALLGAHAAFGTWLHTEIETGRAGLAFALIDWQRRTMTKLIRHALNTSQWDACQNVLQPLDDYFDVRGLDEEARAVVDLVRTATEKPAGQSPVLDSEDGKLWLFAVGSEANRQLRRQQLDAAYQTYDDLRVALENSPKSSTQQRYLANQYHQLGIVAQKRGDLDQADGWYRKSLTTFEELDNRPGMATSYHQLGNVAQDRGDLDQADDWYRKSLTIREELGNRPGMAESYHQLGIVAQKRGDLDEADDWYRKSLTILEELGDRPGMATSYHQLGNVAQERGDLDQADDWYRKSLTIKEKLGNRPGMASSYHQLGIVAQDRGALDQADDWYRKSLTIFEELGNRPGMARSYHQLGIVAYLRGDLDQADGWYRKSLAIKEELGSIGQGVTLALRGLLAEEQDRINEAFGYAIRAVALFEEFPHRSSGSAPAQLARLTSQHGDTALRDAWTATTGNQIPADVFNWIAEQDKGATDE